jgi:hypothetical protein
MNPTTNPDPNAVASPSLNSNPGRYRGGIIGMLGASPQAGLLGTIYNAYRQHQQNQQAQNNQMTAMDRTPAGPSANTQPGWSGSAAPPPTPPPDAQPPAQSMDDNASGGFDDGMDKGAIVTSPTRAILGENGPEAVVPLTDQPGARVSTNVVGQGNMHARYRRPQGPDAQRRYSPIKSDVPLLPNRGVR